MSVSIKFKLAFLYSVSFLLSLAIYSALTFYYTKKDLLNDLDNSLCSEVRWLVDVVEPKISNFESETNAISFSLIVVVSRINEIILAFSRKVKGDYNFRRVGM